MSHALSAAVRDQAIREAAAAYGVCARDILSPSRIHRIAHARQDAMVRLRAITDPDGKPRYSLPVIGRAFDRDHTTVVHAIRAIRKRSGAR